MQSHLTTLKNAIHTKNEFRRIAGLMVEQAKELSKPFIGKKIETLKGLTAKFHEAVVINKDVKVTPLPIAKWVNIQNAYITTSYSDLKIEISLCFGNGLGGCIYEEQSFYFGKVEDGVLVSINDDCKVDQTILVFDEQITHIKKLLELQKQIENVKEKIKLPTESYKYISLGEL